jgi:hypothetical protein
VPLAVALSSACARPMFDQIVKLQQDFTDKYVVVDATIPELARFEGHVGQVKTVNMNGRALVQFDAWNNIGWYDIDVARLKVVPKPDGAAAAKSQDVKHTAPRPATKPATTTGEKKLSPLEMARMQGAAKPAGAKPAAGAATGGAKKSTADVLAAARGGKAAAPAKPAAASAEAKSAPAKPAPATTGKMSTADILAAARAKKAAESSAAEAPVEEAPAASEPEVEAPAAAPAPAAKSAATKTTFAPGQRPSVPEILAWCREHDAK